MKGIDEERRREVGVNLTGGKTNAVEICQKILGAPSLDELLERFEAHVRKQQSSTESASAATESPTEATAASLP